MAGFNEIVVTEVTKENFEELWPCMVKDIKAASFIAVDAEMSGLGSKTMNPNIDERYAELCAAAATRSIISLGLSCFRTDSVEISDKLEYSVAVYNIVLLCSEAYTIDPNAVKFLTQHGFDFNRQFSVGLPYYKGNDKPNTDCKNHTIRNLFAELLRQRKPLVLHNGLADLIFMYQSFYAHCPLKLAAFMADLSEMFPGGICDTKYIAEFSEHASASFLLFVFKMACLRNATLLESEEVSVNIKFNSKNKWSVAIPAATPTTKVYSIAAATKPVKICEKYSAYGWCIKGDSCPRSHDIDSIVLFHLQRKPRGRKRKKPKCDDLKVDHAEEDNKSDLVPSFQTNDVSCESNEAKTFKETLPSQHRSIRKGHRSGLDAFMTGYAFALFVVRHSKIGDIFSIPQGDEANEKEFTQVIPFLKSDLRISVINKLYLSGKSIPLQVCKSRFTKSSKNHTEKLIRVYLGS